MLVPMNCVQVRCTNAGVEENQSPTQKLKTCCSPSISVELSFSGALQDHAFRQTIKDREQTEH